MDSDDLRERNFEREFLYSTSRSSGPGGQNVNKVNTKVELRFNLKSTWLLSEAEKELIFIKLKNKINSEGEIILVSQSERTQILNKSSVTDKFYNLISKALTIPLKRRSTRPTMASKVKRLDTKKSRANIKKLRKNFGNSEG